MGTADVNNRSESCQYLPVEVCEFEVEEAAGEAAETEVGTQPSRAGQ